MPSIVRRVLIAALLVAAFLASPAAASTPEPPATPRDYVVDLAGVMPEEVKARLNAYLGELEQKTTAQVLVLTVQSLDGEEIRSFGLKVAERWRLGKRGKDNGVLFVVAVRDRKYTIEVGYGLESILPDSYVGTVGREYLVPYFRKGDYGTGIYAATLAVANTIASQEGVTITGMPAVQLPRRLPEGRPFGILHAAALAIFLVVALLGCHSKTKANADLLASLDTELSRTEVEVQKCVRALDERSEALASKLSLLHDTHQRAMIRNYANVVPLVRAEGNARKSFDAFFNVFYPDNGHKGHHLLLLDEGVVFFRLGE